MRARRGAPPRRNKARRSRSWALERRLIPVPQGADRLARDVFEDVLGPANTVVRVHALVQEVDGVRVLLVEPVQEPAGGRPAVVPVPAAAPPITHAVAALVARPFGETLDQPE